MELLTSKRAVGDLMTAGAPLEPDVHSATGQIGAGSTGFVNDRLVSSWYRRASKRRETIDGILEEDETGWCLPHLQLTHLGHCLAPQI